MLNYLLIAKQGCTGLHAPASEYEDLLGAACLGLATALRRTNDDEPEERRAAYLRLSARNSALNYLRGVRRRAYGIPLGFLSVMAQERQQSFLHVGEAHDQEDSGQGLHQFVSPNGDAEALIGAAEVVAPLLAVRDAVRENMGPDPIGVLRRLFGPRSSVERNLIADLRRTIADTCGGLIVSARQVREVIS